MKESEFIELLNLYLDHEISAADAARLERELQTNLERRRVYREYCRMHKACALLAGELQAEAPTSRARLGEEKFGWSTGWSQRTGLFVAGSAAIAAAFAAIVFLVQKPAATTAADSPALARTTPAGSPTAPGVPPSRAAGEVQVLTPRELAVAASQSAAAQARRTLVADSLVLSGSGLSADTVASLLPSGEDELAWVRNFQMVSLQERRKLEQLRFDAPPPSLRPQGRPLGGRNASEAEVEMTAFRFLK